MNDDRERQLNAILNVVKRLTEELGPTFEHVDRKVCAQMKGAVSIRQVREDLEELDRRHAITIEEKEPDEGGWILA